MRTSRTRLLGVTMFRLVLSCLPRKKAGEKIRKQTTFRRVLKPKMSLKRGSCLFNTLLGSLTGIGSFAGCGPVPTFRAFVSEALEMPSTMKSSATLQAERSRLESAWHNKSRSVAACVSLEIIQDCQMLIAGQRRLSGLRDLDAHCLDLHLPHASSHRSRIVWAMACAASLDVKLF